MGFSVITTDTDITANGGIFIPTSSIQQFGSFEEDTTYSEGYIIESLLAVLSYKLTEYRKENRPLGIEIHRTERSRGSRAKSVRSLISISHMISFSRGTITMLPLSERPPQGIVVDLPLNSIFRDIRTISSSDIRLSEGVLMDGETSDVFRLNNSGFDALSDNREELSDLIYHICSIITQNEGINLPSVSSARSIDHGTIQLLPHLIPTISGLANISDTEFENSCFYKLGFIWDQDFTLADDTLTELRIKGQ